MSTNKYNLVTDEERKVHEIIEKALSDLSDASAHKVLRKLCHDRDRVYMKAGLIEARSAAAGARARNIVATPKRESSKKKPKVIDPVLKEKMDRYYDMEASKTLMIERDSLKGFLKATIDGNSHRIPGNKRVSEDEYKVLIRAVSARLRDGLKIFLESA